jgi:hypothetical protein
VSILKGRSSVVVEVSPSIEHLSPLVEAAPFPGVAWFDDLTRPELDHRLPLIESMRGSIESMRRIIWPNETRTPDCEKGHHKEETWHREEETWHREEETWHRGDEASMRIRLPPSILGTSASLVRAGTIDDPRARCGFRRAKTCNGAPDQRRHHF